MDSPVSLVELSARLTTFMSSHTDVKHARAPATSNSAVTCRRCHSGPVLGFLKDPYDPDEAMEEELEVLPGVLR